LGDIEHWNQPLQITYNVNKKNTRHPSRVNNFAKYSVFQKK